MAPHTETAANQGSQIGGESLRGRGLRCMRLLDTRQSYVKKTDRPHGIVGLPSHSVLEHV
eukprot:5443345-Pleurochrysis_carterae.AAC.1